MGLKSYIISGLLIGLFAFSFFMFIFQFTTDNGSTTLVKDPTLNKTFWSLNQTLTGVQSQGENEYNATTNEPVSAGFGSLILFSIRGAGNIFGGTFKSIVNPIMLMSTEVLGIHPIVLGVIITIILVTLIFLAWKMYRLGI